MRINDHLATSRADVIEILLAVGLVLVDAKLAILERLLAVSADEAFAMPLLGERRNVGALGTGMDEGEIVRQPRRMNEPRSS